MGGGGPPSPPGSVPPWITSGFSWSRVGLAKWFIRMQGSDTSRLACFFKDLQSILWQCFTWKARYCNASLLLSPLSLSPQPYLSSTSRASSGDRLFKPPKKAETPWKIVTHVHKEAVKIEGKMFTKHETQSNIILKHLKTIL